MNIYPLVFSNNPRYRVSRHVLFWSLWVIYFTFMYAFSRTSSISFKTALTSSFVEICIFTPIDIIHCYLIIYFLLPRYLFKGRYLTFIFLWLLFTLLAIMVTQLELTYVISSVRDAFHINKPVQSRNFFFFFYDNFAFYNMQGCLAAAIKLGKMWYIKQEELNLLKKEKHHFDVHSKNGMMQPVFLLNALESIKYQSSHKPAVVPGMISKIKDLLLYVIFENNQARTTLKKEIDLLEEYMSLEKISNPGLCTSLRVSGDVGDNRIAPFIILPLAENSFRQLAALETSHKRMDVLLMVKDGWMTLKLTWNKPTDTAALSYGINDFLQHIRKRLDLLYPESHEMKMVIESEKFTISLVIDLHRAIN